MENDDWDFFNKYKDIIFNVDISNPYMKDLEKLNPSTKIFSEVLKKYNYNKIINLEMIINSDNELNFLSKSLYNFIKTYSL